MLSLRRSGTPLLSRRDSSSPDLAGFSMETRLPGNMLSQSPEQLNSRLIFKGP